MANKKAIETPTDKRVRELKEVRASISTIVGACKELERVSYALIKRTDALAVTVDKLSLAVSEIQRKLK